ncbi:MAG: hypothetical protein Q8911_03960 [Bacillota bacterium]|nr:hypothetical protein [Bacillota bacterium]
MKKKLRIIFVWTLVSLLLQYGAYSILNKKIEDVMAPVNNDSPITLQLKATIPGSDLTNVQISYAKDYLAYTEDGTLKVFNLTNEKVVFEKKPSSNDTSYGVLTYQWLPDRNTLLYFYAKKNPNPVTYVTVNPPKTITQAQNQQTQKQAQTQTQEPKSEDPNEKVSKEIPKSTIKETPKEVPAEPRVEKRYSNPQITELYSLELPNSDEDTPPDDRFNQTIEKFPSGGKIEELVVSTTTNLMYLTVKNDSSELLMEIDVMKNVRTLSKTGESIAAMAASDRYGTLYIDSKVGSTRQVVALAGTNRQIISKNTKDRVLGIRDGNVYIGEVKNNELVKIKTTPDLAQPKNNPSLKTVWDGAIPFDETVRTLIGAKGQVVIYDHQTAYVVTGGQLAKVDLHGDENYVSVDGAELIQLTKKGTSTLAELQPLNP